MRYKTGIERATMCPFCQISVENELHFVLCVLLLMTRDVSTSSQSIIIIRVVFVRRSFCQTKTETNYAQSSYLFVSSTETTTNNHVLVYINRDDYDNVDIVADYYYYHTQNVHIVT